MRILYMLILFFFSSRRRHTRWPRDWSSDVCSSDLMTMDDIDAENLDFGESTGGIQDGNIDAAFITAGTPTGAVEGLSATEDGSIVPGDKEKAEELVEKYPYYAADTVPEGAYGLEDDVDTV